MRLNHKLRFGVLVLPDTSWKNIVKRFKYIEELGFDIVGTGDHFFDPSRPNEPWYEIWTLLAAIASETTRIRLGSYVTQIPFRNPALLAREALAIDHISDGRLELGLGTGIVTDPACSIMGIPNWDNKERVARFKEYVEIVDQLLSNETTSYKGRYYEIRNAVIYPRPIQKPRPPIVIAALGSTMLKYAARYADTWNTLSWGSTFEEQLDDTRKRTQLIDEYCADVGRTPSSLRHSFLMYPVGARTKKGGMISYYESEEAFVDMVQKLIDVGITEFLLYYPFNMEQLPMFDKLAKEVIPELKVKYNRR
jgi:alkanesulfonate monooxygenase SsuD/methylene tetrahydromethanopterin reductase-like flavin-dependent oxidoreductase (luciferase family)